jgi:hypothetical protein
MQGALPRASDIQVDALAERGHLAGGQPLDSSPVVIGIIQIVHGPTVRHLDPHGPIRARQGHLPQGFVGARSTTFLVFEDRSTGPDVRSTSRIAEGGSEPSPRTCPLLLSSRPRWGLDQRTHSAIPRRNSEGPVERASSAS